jgi:hypothetical protein
MADTRPLERNTWFWVNLAALLVLIPLATIFFQRHLNLYFTGIVLVGGVFTAWALVRLLWVIVEKATRFDGEDYSLRQLSSPGSTRLLIVAGIVLAALWFTTSSLYFEAAGSGGREFEIEIVDPTTGQQFMKPVVLNPSAAVAGAPRFLQFHETKLRCRITKPVGYEPHDCSVRPGQSRRFNVPASFSETEIHLVRLVPTAPLYRFLPVASGPGPGSSNYRVEIEVRRAGTLQVIPKQTWPALRRETVYVMPTDSDKQELTKGLEDEKEYRETLLTRMRAAHISEPGAQEIAAVLSSSRGDWPVAHLRKGDEISIEVITLPDPDNITAGETRSTAVHVVTAEKVQTIWLRKP